MIETQTGRPTVIDDGVVRKLEDALKQGFSVLKACELSGISRSTYYAHMANSSDFSDKMTIAQQWIADQAKLVVAKAIKKGDLASAKWWLERKARDEFGAKASDSVINDEPPQETGHVFLKQIAEAIYKANEGTDPAAPPNI